MPIYEYRCTACGRTVEVLQKLSDDPLERCEACDGAMEKVVSRTAFLLKGGGWYASGYHKDGSPAEPSKGSEPSDGSTTKPDTTKTDAPESSGGTKPGGCGPGCACH